MTRQRCESFKLVAAVRGQKGKDGKPLMVKVPCNIMQEHSIHANEYWWKDGSLQIRGGWT